MAFAPTDDRTLVSAGADHTAVLWDLAGPGPVPAAAPLAGMQAVNALAISRSGLLARGAKDGTVALWDMTDPSRPRPWGDPLVVPAEVRSLAFSPDGTLLAAAAMNGSLTLWRVAGTGATSRLGSTTVATGGAFWLAFDPNRQRVAVAGDDSTVSLWDVSDPTRPARIGAAGIANRAGVLSRDLTGREVAGQRGR